MTTSSCSISPISKAVFTLELAKKSAMRLKSALRNFDCVAEIEAFRNIFHDKFHVVGQQLGYTDLLTAIFGVNKLNEIEAQALIVDEALPWKQVIQRRKDQAEALEQFIRLHAPVLAFSVPENLLVQCMYLVDLVQPLAVAEDKYAANFHEVAQAKEEGRLIEKALEVYENLVINPDPKQADVYQAIALHFLEDDPVIRSSPRWEMLLLEVGTIATDWINTGEPVKTWRGILALSAMSKLGEVYAGMQVAQSLFHKADIPRIDKRLALDIIEEVFEHYRQRRKNGPVFAAPGSEGELFQNYNTIVGEAIRNSDEPEEISRLTQNLLTVLLEGAEMRMPGFAACALCILTPGFPPLHDTDDPENDRLFALRHKISGFPAAEAYCHQLSETAQVKRLQKRFY
ncbi:hypothetical protein LF927_01720 [Pectobacterium polaris]|uniref:hypothetical protein n=1 Tax=Pectobacterium polaris TaxID=2042057 RepID=UPI001CF5C083|nr:hypothetical protein [Pectobacterium polaris]MCA6939909.1 hypothetical protein [Pectobacterium polaris]MCA6955524.1 hypothetical protein [Pectobacterium polaris]